MNLQKVAESAVIGSLIRPKAKYSLYDHLTESSCFLGAVIEGAGLVDFNSYDNFGFSDSLVLQSLFLGKCPILLKPLRIHHSLAHLCVSLNNHTDLSREDIADLLASIKDFDPPVQSPPVPVEEEVACETV